MLGQTIPSMGNGNKEGPIAYGAQLHTTESTRQQGNRVKGEGVSRLDISHALELVG